MAAPTLPTACSVMLAFVVVACVPAETPSAPPSATHTPIPRAISTPRPTSPPSPVPLPSPDPYDWMAHQRMAMTAAASSDVAALGYLPRYEIELGLGVESLTLTGNQVTVYVNNEAVEMKELYFNLFPNSQRFAASMEVLSASVGGTRLGLEYERDATVVKLPLPEPLPPGEAITVTLDFTARVPHVQKNYYLVFAMAQGVVSLGDWHPMLAVYDDEGWNLDYPQGTVGEIVFSESAFYTVRLKLPIPLEVIATGVEAARLVDSEGTQTSVYYSGPVRDFHIVISDRYQVATGGVDDTIINSYYWAEHEVCGREILGFAEEALRLYNELFGPYPFSELDLAEADLWPWAIEWPGLILIGEPLYSDPEEACGEWHVVHEVAHQWWYSVVGNDQVDDPWLDEALANYSTMLYYQMVHDADTSKAAIDEHINRRYEDYVTAYGDGIVGGSTRDYTTASYYPLVYAKGSLFFEDLRSLMGDDAFFEGLQSYYREQKYGVATPEDLIEAMETAHGQPLGDFFERWIYSAEGA